MLRNSEGSFSAPMTNPACLLSNPLLMTRQFNCWRVRLSTAADRIVCIYLDFVLCRDASLKLLVVPRDEDILQMAYQNSVYRAGGVEPHRGDSTDIPEPPAPAAGPTQPRPAGAAAAPPRQLHSYAGRGRHMSDSALSVHRAGRGPGTQQPPQPGKASKYKAELRVLPEDNASQVRFQRQKCLAICFWCQKRESVCRLPPFVDIPEETEKDNRTTGRPRF